MWYFAWTLGTLLACLFAIVTAMWFEFNEDKKQVEDK